ncbi:MAG TPA: hypothetical protein VN667_08875 [Burkholderiales bacterium]|nr:hypothetical protein [Burkholderiales bacterium]
MAQRFLSAPKKASRRQRGFAARRERGVAAHRQHGFAAIVGIIIVVIIGLMAATLGYLSSNSAAGGAGLNQSGEAFFIAKSGIEYAGFNLGAGTACGSLSTAAQTVGTGTFTLSGGTLYNSSTTNVGTGGITSSTATTIPVNSVASLASHGLVSIAGEDIQYGGTSTDATACSPANAPCLLGARRGYSGSTASSSVSAGTAVTQLQCVVRSTGTVSGSPGATRVLEASFQIVNPVVVYPQAMIVYTKSSTQAYSRVWDPTTGGWGSETTAPVAGTGGGTATTLQFVRLALARTRNEAVLALKDTNGQIFVQTWDGTTWTTQNSNARISNPGVGGTPNPLYGRAVDVVYQTANDIATIVYDPGSGSATPIFATWNGTTLCIAATCGAASNSTNVPSPGSANTPWWIELAANPSATSNEVAMIVLEGRTSNTTPRNVVVNVFSGGTEGTATWPATAVINGGAAFATTATDATLRKAVAVAYEGNSGRAMYAWADGTTAGKISYTVYTGTVQSVAPTFTTIGTSTGIGQWLDLASAPNSNNILATLQSANKNLDTLLWTGSAWSSAHPQHDAAVLSLSERSATFTFETHPGSPGYGWLAWGDGAGVSRRRFEGGTTWSNVVSVSVAAGSPTVSFAALKANPVSGRLFDGLYSSVSSAVPGVWTNTRTGAIRDAFNTDDVKGWFAPPVSGSAFSGRLTATTSAASPAGERVAVAVRPAGAALIEMQEIYP